MSFFAGWVIRGMVTEQSKQSEPIEEPTQPERSLLELAFWPFTFVVKLLVCAAVLIVLLAVGGIWLQRCLWLGIWVMDYMETFAKLYDWSIGKRALYLVTPGLIAMALYWTASVFIVGGAFRVARNALQRRVTRREVRAILRQAKSEARG